MARRVFFSFHYQRDVWRSSVVRNSYITHRGRETTRFRDGSLWEEAQKKGDAAIKRLIDEGLKNTSATVVLIGKETAQRPYVQYEIVKSWERGNRLLGVRIHQIPDQHSETQWFGGPNPFEQFKVGGRRMSSFVPVYDWVENDGYNNLARWIESAPHREAVPPEKWYELTI